MSSLAYRLYHDELRFPERGSPEIVLGLLRDFMSHVALSSDTGWRLGTTRHPEVAAVDADFRQTFGLDDPRTVLILYLLDALKLTQHGSSVFGSHLTAKGRELLTFLQAVPEADWVRADGGLDIECVHSLHDLAPISTVLARVGGVLLEQADAGKASMPASQVEAMQVLAARLHVYQAEVEATVAESRRGSPPNGGYDIVGFRQVADILEDLEIANHMLGGIDGFHMAPLEWDFEVGVLKSIIPDLEAIARPDTVHTTAERTQS